MTATCVIIICCSSSSSSMLAATVSHSLTARVARSLTAARAVHASYHLSLRHLVTDRVSERGTAIGHDRPFVPAHFNRDFENITNNNQSETARPECVVGLKDPEEKIRRSCNQCGAILSCLFFPFAFLPHPPLLPLPVLIPFPLLGVGLLR